MLWIVMLESSLQSKFVRRDPAVRFPAWLLGSQLCEYDRISAMYAIEIALAPRLRQTHALLLCACELDVWGRHGHIRDLLAPSSPCVFLVTLPSAEYSVFRMCFVLGRRGNKGRLVCRLVGVRQRRPRRGEPALGGVPVFVVWTAVTAGGVVCSRRGLGLRAAVLPTRRLLVTIDRSQPSS